MSKVEGVCSGEERIGAIGCTITENAVTGDVAEDDFVYMSTYRKGVGIVDFAFVLVNVQGIKASRKGSIISGILTTAGLGLDGTDKTSEGDISNGAMIAVQAGAINGIFCIARESQTPPTYGQQPCSNKGFLHFCGYSIYVINAKVLTFKEILSIICMVFVEKILIVEVFLCVCILFFSSRRQIRFGDVVFIDNFF